MKSGVAAPPPTLLGCLVVKYAALSRLTYSGHSHLFVGGVELGPVPRLAICRPSKGSSVLLVHCGRKWRALGTSELPSLRAAEARAERAYPGVSDRWVRTGFSKRQATAHLSSLSKGLRCSFCGRGPYQVSSMVQRRQSRICNVCLQEFSLMQSP